MAGRWRCVAVAFLVAVCLSGPIGLAHGAPPHRRPPAKGLSKLWHAYPLGEPLTTPSTQSRGTTAPPKARKPETPPRRPTGTKHGGSSFPITAVVVALAVALLAVLGFAGRRRLRVGRAGRRMRSGSERDVPNLSREAAGLVREIDRQLGPFLPASADAVARRAGPASVVAPTGQKWDKYNLQRREAVLKRSDDRRDSESEAAGYSSIEDGPRSYSEIGERVARVLERAEDLAEQIRAEARAEAELIKQRAEEAGTARAAELEHEIELMRAEAEAYAKQIRETAESYASQLGRTTEEEAAKRITEAEEQATATREAAEAMSRRIEDAARRRTEELEQATRATEHRAQSLLGGLRETVSRLEELLGERAPAGESLTDALDVGQRVSVE